jgi:hypothetical protein
MDKAVVRVAVAVASYLLVRWSFRRLAEQVKKNVEVLRRQRVVEPQKAVIKHTSISPDADLEDPSVSGQIARELHRSAAEIIRSEGELRMPLVLLVVRKDLRTMEPCEPAIKVFGPDGRNLQDFVQSPDDYMSLIRAIARNCDAIAAGMVTEMWKVPEEDVDVWQGRFDQHPQRRVELHIHVEHVRRPTDLYMHCSVVEMDGRRLGILTEERDVIKVSGRLGSLLEGRKERS